MQIRNRLGQYAGSYWKSLRTERKVYLLIAAFCFSVIAVGQTYQAVAPIVFREIRYVAAPVAEAAIFESDVKTLDEMKRDVLDRLEKCENPGKKPIVFDTNGIASVGQFQWQPHSFQYYWKKMTGEVTTQLYGSTK